jgi:hypothetical protein
MAKLPKLDVGSQCQSCGKRVEKKYGLNVVVHIKQRRYLQYWCVECVAKAQPGLVSVCRAGELGKDGKLIQL